MKTNNQQVAKVSEAYEKIEHLRSFYVHCIIYVTVNASVYLGSLHGFGLPETFWKISIFVTLVYAGLGVIGHWAGVIGYRIIFPEKKERSLLEKFIKQEENKGV
jgi:2TM domain